MAAGVAARPVALVAAVVVPLWWARQAWAAAEADRGERRAVAAGSRSEGWAQAAAAREAHDLEEVE